MVRVSWWWYLGGGLGVKTVGEGGLRFWRQGGKDSYGCTGLKGMNEKDARVALTDEELTEKEVKQMKADDQAIHTILMGLSEVIYAAIDSCDTSQEIWLHVQQMMKGFDIGVHEKKAKLYNEWESVVDNITPAKVVFIIDIGPKSDPYPKPRPRYQQDLYLMGENSESEFSSAIMLGSQIRRIQLVNTSYQVSYQNTVLEAI
ncbi:hypothetical protein Tco_0529705 [Tanacetum coccineum]